MLKSMRLCIAYIIYVQRFPKGLFVEPSLRALQFFRAAVVGMRRALPCTPILDISICMLFYCAASCESTKVRIITRHFDSTAIVTSMATLDLVPIPSGSLSCWVFDCGQSRNKVGVTAAQRLVEFVPRRVQAPNIKTVGCWRLLCAFRLQTFIC